METPPTALELYMMMLKIRLFEETIVALYPGQEMRTPVHLSIGQEAIAAGVCAHLRKDDVLFSTHRCHGHCLAKGMDMPAMMAELYGKKTGCCRGKGGSMHFCDPEVGIMATSAIVAGGVPMAVGAAWAIHLKGQKRVVANFFGDGATEEGVFFESLNFAALKKLPILFVCENNFYATNSPLAARQPSDNIFQRGVSFGIPGERCDGNDVLAVSRVAGRSLERIRRGQGPRLLEFRTYRWKGHVGPECDVEKGCRPQVEYDRWVRKCPVKKTEQYLIKKRILTKQESVSLRSSLQKEIDDAVALAKSAPWPDPSDMTTDVVGAGGQKTRT